MGLEDIFWGFRGALRVNYGALRVKYEDLKVKYGAFKGL